MISNEQDTNRRRKKKKKCTCSYTRKFDSRDSKWAYSRSKSQYFTRFSNIPENVNAINDCGSLIK